MPVKFPDQIFFYINSHTEWQTVQIQISWLLPDLHCKDTVYPGSAGLGSKVPLKSVAADVLISLFLVHISQRLRIGYSDQFSYD